MTIMSLRFKNFSAIVVCLGLASFCQAQNAPADQQNTPQATAPATPLSTPSITGPLQAAPPIVIDGGPLGKLDLNGVVSGIGLWQGRPVPAEGVGAAAPRQ